MTSAQAQNSEYFPPIGSVATETDLLPETTDEKNENREDDDIDDRPMQEVSSLCMTCGEEGRTRMLLTSIPFFREVIVMSFRCEHCGNENNEIQSAGAVRDQGTLFTAKIVSRADLNRQLVKSETCTVVIPDHELTIPAHRGQLTTVEGLLRDTIKDLALGQPLRRIQDEAAYNKIQRILDVFEEIIGDDDADESQREDIEQSAIAALAHPFTVQLDDPAGNSFLEFYGTMSDPKWNMRQYTRTKEQNITLGLAQGYEDAQTPAKQIAHPPDVTDLVDNFEPEEIIAFPGQCSSCSRPLDTLMKRVVIPYFKDVIIMSTNCDNCGYRDNEVKSGSSVSVKGKKVTLKVEDRDDLSRDLLKSETCGLQIPEIDLVLQPGTLGGRFTTVEGILEQIYEDLNEKVFTDSVIEGDNAYVNFLTKLKQECVKAAEVPFTLILDDPLANSYVQNLYAPDPDPNMQMEVYDRTWEQNEDLGLNDMITEGYDAQEKDNSSSRDKARVPQDAET